jgi:hypothetical protein
VIDECGICNGNNDAKGCDGKCFSNTRKDDCGVCGGDNEAKGCDNVCFSERKADLCGSCGGNVVDAKLCTNDCATVPATKSIKNFEKKFMNLAKSLADRIAEDAKRDATYRCGLNSAQAVRRSQQLITMLSSKSRAIFASGVKVCGGSCVTVSFAKQVKGERPKLKELQDLSRALAKKVGDCRETKKIRLNPSSGGGTQHPDLITQTNEGLSDLINACKKTKVCGPGH